MPCTGLIAITEETTLHFAAFDRAGNHTVMDGTYRPPAGTDEPLAAPTGLTATAGQGTVNLRWSAVTGATSYQVTVYQAGEQSGVPLDPTTATTQTAADLVPGTPYGFTVRALAGTAVGPESQTVSATPLPVTDMVTVTTARWKAGDFRVDGTGPLPGAVITLYTVAANGGIGVPIANAETTVVAAVAPEVGGAWTVRLRNAAAPAVTPGRIYAKSSAGGVAGPVDVVSK